MNPTHRSRKIVLGLGNTLNSDEGLGVHALKTLKARIAPDLDPPSQGEKGEYAEGELEFLDGGVLGLNLLPWVEECSHLLVLDAINAHKEPGTLVELKRDEIPLYNGIKLSDHQVTFQEVLGLAKFRGKLPENLYLIGIQPANLSIGVDLSPIVQAAIPQVVRRAEDILRGWGLIGVHEPVRDDRVAILEGQLADLKKRWPAHSTPPALLQQLDELEAELEFIRQNRAEQHHSNGAPT
jgi:hydrogenase maturation protease